MSIFSSLSFFLDVPHTNSAQNWQRGFQTPASPIAEGIFAFHDDLRIFLSGILCFVVYVFAACLNRFARTENHSTSLRFTHASTIEIVWTILPALILIVIAIPSFSLLYSRDEIIEPLLTVKVIGHQWYWSYEFLDPEVIANLYNDTLNTYGRSLETIGSGSFDSYRLSDDELLAGEGLTSLRLLTVDNYLFLPAETHVRARVTSADVLHSWAIPSLGIKLDACPGRLNQTSLFIKREGIYYGQCSEICGVNHGFRPIGIVSLDLFGGVSNSAIDFEPVLSILQAEAYDKLFFEEVAERSKAADCKSVGFSLRWFKSNFLQKKFLFFCYEQLSYQ